VGGLWGSTESASRRADDILPLPRRAWSDSRRSGFVTRRTALCLSSLLAASRLQETSQPARPVRRPIWPRRRYGIRAPRAQGLFDEALAYAEVSRGLNIPDSAVDAECDRSR
jgi:hypothetical protein